MLQASWKLLSKSSLSFSTNSTLLNAMIALESHTDIADVYIREPIANIHTLNQIVMEKARIIPQVISNVESSRNILMVLFLNLWFFHNVQNSIRKNDIANCSKAIYLAGSSSMHTLCMVG
jgi:hypothetical protein